METKIQNYPKFRWFFTKNNFLVLAGKSAEQNENLIKNYLDKKDIVLHTKEPGSPFCVIKAKPRKKISKQDIKETSQFCACFSQQWKQQSKTGKAKKVEVHIFNAEQISKEKRQKTGTFAVIGKIQKILVSLELWTGIQKNKLRAAPKSCLKKPLIKILPGKMAKEKAVKAIKEKINKKFNIKINNDEINQAIPSGGFSA